METQVLAKKSREKAERTGNRIPTAAKRWLAKIAQQPAFFALDDTPENRREVLTALRAGVKPDCTIGKNDDSGGEFPTIRDIAAKLHEINRGVDVNGNPMNVPTYDEGLGFGVSTRKAIDEAAADARALALLATRSSIAAKKK